MVQVDRGLREGDGNVWGNGDEFAKIEVIMVEWTILKYLAPRCGHW